MSFSSLSHEVILISRTIRTGARCVVDDLLGVTAFGEAAQPSVIVGRDNDQIDFADPRRGQNLRSRLTAAKERLGVRVLGSDDIEQRKQI